MSGQLKHFLGAKGIDIRIMTPYNHMLMHLWLLKLSIFKSLSGRLSFRMHHIPFAPFCALLQISLHLKRNYGITESLLPYPAALWSVDPSS